MEKVRYLSLFSGIGAFEKALINLNIDFDLVGYCEIDKYASKSYSEIFDVPESMNFGDITKIDETKLPEIDFITYGFPCQDISLSGKQKGLFNEDGSKTRSGLFFDALRIIKATQPKVAIAENVKNLTSKKFSEQFRIVLESLEEAGYNNYWKILKSSDFGIPQKRERVFIVSIRKDVDTKIFEFPKPYELKKCLMDLCEDSVDEKYYLSQKMISYILDMKDVQKGTKWEGRADGDILNPQIAHTLSVRGAGGCQRAGVSNFIVENINHEIMVKDLKKFITINQSGKIALVKEATKIGYAAAAAGDSINLEQPNSTTRRGRVGHGVAQTLTTSCNQAVVEEDLKIRRLTPKECFRLQGFSDSDFEKCSSSNAQLYKQAGNSITVDVAEELLCMLFDEEGNFFI